MNVCGCPHNTETTEYLLNYLYTNAALPHVDGTGFGRGLRHWGLVHAPSRAFLPVPHLPHLSVTRQRFDRQTDRFRDRLDVKWNKRGRAVMANLCPDAAK